MTTNNETTFETLLKTKHHPITLKQQNCLHSQAESEKSKFFNILKSLFAIFDPNCKGSIDLNELDVLGANNNEILNDVLHHIRSSTLRSQQKVLKTVNTNLCTLSKRTKLNSSAQNQPFYVTFDEFVQAAEVVLEKRKQQRLTQMQQTKYPSIPIKIVNQTNIVSPSSSSSSCSSSMSPTTTTTTTTTNTQTLSQAFEATNLEPNNNNANSFDLHSLIEKENVLLKQGLDNIDNLKQWFTNQLIENKLKQTNANKLKYQNLFSIDKMLIELKQLNDLNQTFTHFLKKNSNNSNSKCLIEQQPPSYKDYVEQFALMNSVNSINSVGAKFDVELEKYLKEKQEKIEGLQKEKSSLIRKLFEIKSESENISKTILKLNCKEPVTRNVTEKEIPIIIDSGKQTTGSNNSAICNLVQANTSKGSLLGAGQKYF